MSTTYTSAVPLAMVRTVDGGYVSVYQDEPISGESVDPDNLKRLVRKGFLVKSEAAGAGDGDGKPTSVKDILKDVGDDKAKAQEYLDEENAADKPRATLVEGLQAVLAAE